MDNFEERSDQIINFAAVSNAIHDFLCGQARFKNMMDLFHYPDPDYDNKNSNPKAFVLWYFQLEYPIKVRVAYYGPNQLQYRCSLRDGAWSDKRRYKKWRGISMSVSKQVFDSFLGSLKPGHAQLFCEQSTDALEKDILDFFPGFKLYSAYLCAEGRKLCINMFTVDWTPEAKGLTSLTLKLYHKN